MRKILERGPRYIPALEIDKQLSEVLWAHEQLSKLPGTKTRKRTVKKKEFVECQACKEFIGTPDGRWACKVGIAQCVHRA